MRIHGRFTAVDVASRLWAKLDKSKECWNWTGNKDKDGYGKIVSVGKTIRTHRLAWELTNGPIPKGLMVLHRCDNPSCCNPAHLFVGNNSDNMKDKFARGRENHKGSNNRMAKLTEEQVVSIRADLRQRQVIAKCFGVSEATISNIVLGRTWNHLPVGNPPKTQV